MANEDFVVRFELDVAAAVQNANRLSQALGNVVSSLNAAQGPTQAIAQNLGAVAPAATRATSSVRSFSGNLPTLRYALYDVASTLGIVGAAFTAVDVAAIGTAVAWERAYANVIRTTGATGDEVARIRAELVGLTREIPVAFTDLTEIAALGGQLGIAASDIDEFTSVVARLTATTDLTAEAAGTALGRFQALLGVPASEFENLASAILNVGVNSVATETQIVSIATQISSMADFAGLTADEVIGLAGALASVGAAPELSRGTITRLFTQMSRAVAQGGDRLDEFARISGVSAQEFAAGFGRPGFGDTVLAFLTNLGDEGGNAVQVLNDLGITSVRDVPLLLRLAGASDAVQRAFKDSVDAYATATVLQEQYGIIAETTAARLEILMNAVQELFAVLGGSATGPFKEFVNFLIDSLHNLTDALSTDFGQGVSIAVLVLTGLIGALALAGAGVALFTASMLASVTAYAAFTGKTITATTVMNGFTASMVRARAAVIGLVAAVAGVALISTPSNVDKFFGGSWFDGQTIREATDQLLRFQRIDFNTSGWNSFFGEFQRNAMEGGFGGLFGADSSSSISALTEYDKRLAALASTAGGSGTVFAELDRISAHYGITNEQVLSKLPDTRDALLGVATGANTTTEAIRRQAEETKLLEQRQAFLQDTMLLSEDGFKRWSAAIQGASFSLSDALKAATEEGILSLEKLNTEIQSQITAFESFQTNLLRLAASGVDPIVLQELVAQGPIAGAQLAQALVDNFGTELGNESLRLIQAGAETAAAYQEGFSDNIALITAAFQQAGDAAGAAMLQAILSGASADKIQAVISQYNLQVPVTPVLTGPVTGRLSAGDFLPWATRASGGPVHGPGSGTSDSVPTLLSNGEYVIRAASVRKYGSGLFDALNRGVARFASGGAVGGGMSFPNSMITEFGPQSMAAVRGLGGAQVNVMLDDLAIARAANRGNKLLAQQGAY